jgi:hypothetical protein
MDINDTGLEMCLHFIGRRGRRSVRVALASMSIKKLVVVLLMT